MANAEPIFLEPVFKCTLWGGRLLKEEFGCATPDGPVGECWAISGHPHGDCTVAEGRFEGMRLSELWTSHPELFGNVAGKHFPLLVKILGAAEDLSIQVHPDNAYAAEHEDGNLGKHECWYVLKAKENGQILVGQKAQSREEFVRLAKEGRWEDLVNRLPVASGDFFDINPGIVHAIMGGTLVIEVQQCSDITYRVWDYDRRQADGTLRETHFARALDVIDYSAPIPSSGTIEAEEVDGVTHLLSSADFSVDRVRVEGEKALAQPWPFLCLSVVDGSGELEMGGRKHALPKGASVIIPCDCGDLRLNGQMTLIVAHL